MAAPRAIVPLKAQAQLAAVHQVQYHGGPVIGSVEVAPVFWGAYWASGAGAQMANQVNAFFDLILTSSLMDLLWEYSTETIGIGRGRRLPAVVVGGQPSSPVTDAQIQRALQDWIAKGTVPATTPNTLYFNFLPPNVTCLGPTGQQSCAPGGFCGYHGHIGGSIFYGVIPYIGGPDCTGRDFAGAGVLDAITKASSHELAEAVTDPALNGWFDPNTGDEIADICNDSTARLGPYFVQTVWSNTDNTCLLKPSNPPWSHPVAVADRLSYDVDQIVVASNRDGRLEVFMRGSHDGRLYHKWQTI